MYLGNPLVGLLHLGDIGDRREVGGLQCLEIQLPIRGDILYVHLVVYQGLTVLYTKGL